MTLKTMIEKIIKLRKKLHQHPELSGLESETQKRIRLFIKKHNPATSIKKIGQGLAAIYKYSATGPVVAIRCEMDALPILEKNQFSHKSLNKGISHKCGHDGHMATVLGLIFWLKEQQFKKGKIILLFQSAEETGKGAQKMLQDQAFEKLGINYIFALHNIPGFPLHHIISMEHGFSAEVQSFSIHLKGKESHASEPENGINPAKAISEIINKLSNLNVEDPLDPDFSVLTAVHLNMGAKAYGISPANGELHYTLRSWNTEKMAYLESEIESICKSVCHNHKLGCELKWFEHFPASKNDLYCNKLVREAAGMNGFEIVERPYPFKFGEDFGWFSKKYKTAMFGLGTGENSAALHHANYDFQDEIIETGMQMFESIITKIMDE